MELKVSHCIYHSQDQQLLKAYLYIRKAELQTGKERQRSSICWTTPQRVTITGVSPIRMAGVQRLFSPAFSGTLAESWIERDATGPQIGAHMGYWYFMSHFKLLHHNTGFQDQKAFTLSSQNEYCVSYICYSDSSSLYIIKFFMETLKWCKSWHPLPWVLHLCCLFLFKVQILSSKLIFEGIFSIEAIEMNIWITLRQA